MHKYYCVICILLLFSLLLRTHTRHTLGGLDWQNSVNNNNNKSNNVVVFAVVVVVVVVGLSKVISSVSAREHELHNVCLNCIWQILKDGKQCKAGAMLSGHTHTLGAKKHATPKRLSKQKPTTSQTSGQKAKRDFACSFCLCVCVSVLFSVSHFQCPATTRRCCQAASKTKPTAAATAAAFVIVLVVYGPTNVTNPLTHTHTHSHKDRGSRTSR